MYEIILRGGTVIDGTGKRGFQSDVAVKDGRIAAIGNLSNCGGGRTLDVAGRVVCPGFIDIHGHSELRLFTDPSMKAKLRQGVTTELMGNCGVGVVPVRADGRNEWAVKMAGILGKIPLENWTWESFDDFVRVVESEPRGMNSAFLISHGALRHYVMGNRDFEKAGPDDLEAMKAVLEDALNAGAAGLSSGLFYAPCCYAEERELEELCSVLARKDRIFAVHHRCEGDEILSSLDEVLELALHTGVKLQISHLKIAGWRNWDKCGTVLEKIEKYRDRGVNVAFDQYPYIYGSTSLFSLLPPDYLMLSGPDLRKKLADPECRRDMRHQMENPRGWDSIYTFCGWEKVSIASATAGLEHLGRSIAEIARLTDKDPFDAFFDFLMAEKEGATMIDVIMSDENVCQIMAHPLQMFGTDALYVGRPHPRAFNSYVHILDSYVRQKKVLTVEEAVLRMTSRPARRVGIPDRGILKEGMKADIVVFDEKGIRDHSDVEHPDAEPEGMEYVIVNGCIAIERNAVVDGMAGEVIRF